MGGRSKSSSKNETTTNQIDERIAATDSAQVFTLDGNNNTVTDHGAIDKAGNIVFETIELLGEVALKSLDQSKSATETLGFNADKTFEFVDNQNRDENGRTVTEIAPWLILGVSVLAISGAWKFK